MTIQSTFEEGILTWGIIYKSWGICLGPIKKWDGSNDIQVDKYIVLSRQWCTILLIFAWRFFDGTGYFKWFTSVKRQELTELEICSIQKLLDDYSQWSKFQPSTELVSLIDISILSFSLHYGKDLMRALISCATQP